MEEFEKMLTEMQKPEVKNLRHQVLLAEQIIKTKNKAALSWWWLCIPGYMILMLVMKSFYSQKSTLKSSLAELLTKNRLLTNLSFIVLPVVLVIINGVGIYKLYKYSDKPGTWGFAKTAALNIFLIILSLLVLIIFLINN